MKRVTIWQQFSNNHSADFTVVGEFETAEAAQRAADELREMLATIQMWYEQNPEAWEEFQSGDLEPTPPEVEIGQKYQVEWPNAIDWFGVAVVTVFDRLAILTPNDRPDYGAAPFHEIMARLGGRVLVDGDVERDLDVRRIRVDVTCVAPDEATAQQIVSHAENWTSDDADSDDIQRDGLRIDYKDWTFERVDIELPSLLDSLKRQGCADIAYTLKQDEANYGALGSLLDTRDMRPVQTVEGLVAVLKSDKLTGRLNAIVELERMGSEEAIQALIQALRDNFLWNAAAGALGRIGEAAREPLHAALQDSDIRAQAAEALKAMSEAERRPSASSIPVEKLDAIIREERFQHLIRALRDPTTTNPGSAIAELARLGDARAVEPLIALLETDTRQQVRLLAAEALGS